MVDFGSCCPDDKSTLVICVAIFQFNIVMTVVLCHGCFVM